MTLPRRKHKPLDDERQHAEQEAAIKAVVAESKQTPLHFMALFAEFQAPSWDGWRAVLARLTPHVREFYAIVGRGAGKSRIVALLACAFAAREYQRVAGERIYIGVFAPDKKQAGVTFRYIVGLMRSVPALAALIESQTRESLSLRNGVIVEVLSATIAAPRGRSYALVIIEEAAFLPTDESANPDFELLRSVRPALARVPGSLLAVVSSPYAKRGVLWQAWQKYHGRPDSDVVLVQAATLELNPTFDARAVETALEEDEFSARAEYLGEFRNDLEAYVTREAVDAVVVRGRLELPPVRGFVYTAFLDFAGGSGSDSATCAIAHEELREGRRVGILDVIREVRPPFSPEQTCEDFATLIKSYGLYTATADRYAGDFPIERMSAHGVTVFPSERSKSDIYRDFLPRLNSGSVELLDLPRLHAQLVGLERRVARGGRDSIDHPPNGHDDVANAAAGALIEVLPVAHADGGIGRALTDHDPGRLVLTVEDATRELERQQAARNRGVTGSQAALDRFAIERRGFAKPTFYDREQETRGGVLLDGDPF